MSWRTNHFVVMIRDLGRAVGLNKWIASSLFRPQTYEDRYREELVACIQPGDCVWDVGANVGHYTRLFARLVGPQGTVFAFEPSPVNFRRLAEQCSSLSNVRLLQCGLGKADDKLHFKQGGDELGATSRVTANDFGGEVVEIRAGDSLLAEGTVKIPQVVKIDVEGFECEVLEGMVGLIQQAGLRAIGIEIHFGILKERGMRHGPKQIEKLLHGFKFLFKWPDSSHIVAVRN